MSALVRFVLAVLVSTILVLVWVGWTAAAQTGRMVSPSSEQRDSRLHR